MSKTVCIFHGCDLDGWMSAAIVKHWWNNMPETKSADDTLDFIGFNYGDTIPDLSQYYKVIMCDISLPKEIMSRLPSTHDFVWIDHHISAIKDANEQSVSSYCGIKGIRDTSYAACELTWHHLFPTEPMPEIVRLLGRYDCFGHRQIWKSVVGYENLYEVSNHGSVRSLHKEIKELSIANSKRGYRVVSLYKDGNATMKNVHQLVAQAFIQNPSFKPCINHKDANRLNNYVDNLEWCTYEENNLHSIKNGNRGKSVVQFNDNDDVIGEYTSIMEAEKATGIQSQNIGKVCKGERDNAGGFRWEYGIDKEKTPQFIVPSEEQKVLEFQYGARSYIKNYEDAYKYLTHDISDTTDPTGLSMNDRILDAGVSIYEFLCTDAKQSYKNRFEIKFDIPELSGYPENGGEGYKFICINKERFNPINFGIKYHEDGYDGCACFHYANGMYNFSLYNDNGLVDVSVIAKQFGGGGHAGASGFRIKDLSQIVK